MSVEAGGAGPLAALRRLIGTLLELGQTRLELLGNELEQEKERFAQALLLGMIAVLAFGFALMLALAVIALVVPPGDRAAVLGAMALLLAVTGLVMLKMARARLHARGGAFASSIGELTRDRAELDR